MNLITNLKFWLAMLAAAILAALLALAWRQGGAAARAELAAVRAQHADVLRQIAEKTLAAERAVHTASQAWAGQIAALDTQHSKELTHAQTENDRLRAAARAGTVRVRIPGACAGTAAGRDLPAPGSASGVGDAAAEADGALRERVFDLRGQIAQAERQIAYLQDYATTCAAGAP